MDAGSDVFSYLVKALIVDEREGNTSTHRLQEKNERLLHQRRCYTTGLVLFKNGPGFDLGRVDLQHEGWMGGRFFTDQGAF